MNGHDDEYRLLFDRIAETFGVVEVIRNARGDFEDCVIRDANLAFERSVNMRREQFIGRRALQVLGPTIEPYLQTYAQVEATGETVRFDATYEPGDLHFHVTAFALGNGCVGVLSIDTTRRVHAEDALRDMNRTLELRVADRTRQLQASEGRLRLFVEAAPHLAWSCDAAGGLTDANRRWFAYTGLTLEQSRGSGWLQALHPDDVERVSRKIVVDRAGGELFEAEYRLRRASDGAYRWHLARALPVRDAAGVITNWFGSTVDIEDQKQAEATLRRHAQIINQIHDAVIGCRFDGTIDSCNQGTERLLGYTAAELAGRPIQVLFPAHEERVFQDVIAPAVRRDGDHSREVWLSHKSGDRVCVELRVSLLADERGEPTGFIGYGRDITHRKRVEEALQKSHAELEARVKERTAQLRASLGQTMQAEELERKRIAGILHDDLQQLLAGASYCLTAVVKKADEKDRERVAAEVRSALQAAIGLSRSLGKTLRSLALYELGLRAALEDLAEEMWKRFELKLTLELDEAAEPASEDLRVFIFHAVRELLFNVVKHAGCKRASVRIAAVDAESLRVEVRDAGVGLAGPAQARTGVGLITIRERAEFMGGRLSVDTAPGKGTCVMLTLPRQ